MSVVLQLQVDELVNALTDAVLLRLSPAQIAPRLLNIEQAAKYLGRTVWGMRHLVAAGGIPVVRLDGRVQFDIRDLDFFVEKNKE